MEQIPPCTWWRSRRTRPSPPPVAWGMVITLVVGSGTIIGFCFAIQNPDALFDPSSVSGGQQWGAQALWDVWAARYKGDGRGCLGLVAMIVLALNVLLLMWMLGTARKIYAMARDQLLPCSDVFSAVTDRGVPLNAMLLAVGLILILGLLLLVGPNQLVFYNSLSWSATVTYTSYLIPILTRLLSNVQISNGPYDLGRWHTPVYVTSAVFLVLTHVIGAMPQFYPATWLTMNYAGPGWVLVVLLLHVWWFLPAPFGARHWARGPVAGVVAGVEYRL